MNRLVLPRQDLDLSAGRFRLVSSRWTSDLLTSRSSTSTVNVLELRAERVRSTS